MPIEPVIKRAVVFVDGQNLFYAVKKAFGYTFPNYDPDQISRKICELYGWKLEEIRFYTGIPELTDNSFWHHFWTKKLAVMGTRGVHTFARSLRYRHQTVALPDGSSTTILVGQEKGIDIRIALDVVRLALDNKYDIGIILSQDQDLSEVADEIKKISVLQKRWIKVASAFPISPTSENHRGINNTEWIKIDRKFYDSCLDRTNYKPKESKNPK